MTKAPLPSPTHKRDNTSTPPSARPSLQRLAASDAKTYYSQTSPRAQQPPPRPDRDDETTDTDMSEEESQHGEEESQHGEEEEEVGGDVDVAPPGRASPDEVEIDRLRSLQNSLIQHHQQQARMRSSSNATTVAALGLRRISPIKEEPMASMSPTLEGAFTSPSPTPLATGITSSTESTESARTIRGSMPPTPMAHALRTPSYPFPTVPNTPHPFPTVPSTPRWASAFHMPFTSLSPTVSAAYPREYAVPKDRIASESSTPAASSTPFAPGGRHHQTSEGEDPRYPSPNLYDLVLRLGVEPGLMGWWTTVTSIMRDHYGVERATLAVPADVSDIENVPWGQKTSFTATASDSSPRDATYQQGTGRQSHFSPEEPLSVQTFETVDVPPISTIPERRPKLFSHHSFAGHERQKQNMSPDTPTPSAPVRPRGPLRAVSHAPQTAMRPDHPLRQVSQASFDGMSPGFDHATPTGGPSFSDPEFSSVGGEHSPPTAVYHVLRALDHEPDALIDNIGINRVLERGRLVTLTRDYSTSTTLTKEDLLEKDKQEQQRPSAMQGTAAAQEAHKATNARGRASLATSDPRLQQRYEEYEQYPSSPWAQSPAPSPAIQNDADTNPFFATGNVDEETFNPSRSPQDYAQYGMVEAIGVDRASTVTHIPLVHPTLSQAMASTDTSTPAQTPVLSRRQSEQSAATSVPTEGFVRKAPIAILSILSPIVPYPRNLTNSLKHLGPHLATSFSNAWEFTNAQAQVASVRHRRTTATTSGGLSIPSDSDSLDDLLHLDLEDITTSVAGSVTSPSDYSGRSRHSPGGSISGTPGWTIGGTPGHLTGTEAVESYFDARKQYSKSLNPPASNAHEQPVRKSDKRHPPKRVTVNPVPEQVNEDVKARNDNVAMDDLFSTRRGQLHGSSNHGHSLLHSYGADFSSSFQSLPAATTPGGRPQARLGLARRPSITESFEMPPPSESLLRTIIDSLPVQIFTAAPSTGAITWVNSKFLIYRGQDSRQVLQDPWDSIHPEDRASYLEEWSRSLRTGQQLQKKVRLQRFDDCYRWFYVRVAPLKNKRQQIVHWIGTNMDFHEQHLAEQNSARQQETAASEAKYRALANSSPQIVFVVSDRRGLTFSNLQWITYSGQSEIQALGNGFLEHVHPDDVVKCKLPELDEDGVANVPTSMPADHGRPDSSSSDTSSEADKTITSPGCSSPDRMDMPQAKLSKLADTGILRIVKDAHGRASYSTEVRLRNKDGEYRWHLVRVLLEKALSENGDEETWYGTATDINDHKLLEQTLKETMDAKSKFLSNMSHEIRTPLNGISGMVNFLLDSILNAEQLEHVNIIKSSTDSLLNLINDILDLSKVEAGMIKLSIEWLHLPSLLEEVNDLSMGLAIQKGLELNYLVEEGVPAEVKGDKFRIRQVLLNVVGNAIKFTERGEIFIRCRPQQSDRSRALKDNETMVRFEVIDTGQGFTEAEAKYLFKRFSQIDASSTRQHGGTGLGLAISMQFVELHGGRMDARSTPGKGSTFFFTIKFGLPTTDDFPKPKVSTPGTPAFEAPLAVLPVPPNPPQPSALQKFVQSQNPGYPPINRVSSVLSERSEPVKSPVPSLTASERSRDSPSLSSGSSDHSLTSTALTGQSSLRSERSSASSYLQEVSPAPASDSNISLALPPKRPDGEGQPPSGDSSASIESDLTVRPTSQHRSLSPLGSALQPPMYSILVVCPLVHSREATIRHIKNTLPQDIPHQVTGQSSIIEAQRLMGGDNPVLFTHVVLVLHDTAEVHAIMDQIFSSTAYGNSSIVVVSDPSQKKELIKEAPVYDYEQLHLDRRLQFIYRPLKPSKFAIIFDPQKQRDSSTDRNQDSAQQVVVSQKLVFEELKRRVGGKNHKVLLVEDNKINQTVGRLCHTKCLVVLTFPRSS
jgi:PAS domain S-box-containing protein